MPKARAVKVKSRKYLGRCEGCRTALCACKVYQYVDESNAAITENSPYLCAKCYESKYGIKIPTDVGKYRDSLIRYLMSLVASAKSAELERALKFVIEHISENP